MADPTLTGIARFGFVSRYQNGAAVPSGNAHFQFKAGELVFKSTDYQWLVVAGARVQLKGQGTINGIDGFAFHLTAIDGELLGGDHPDRFRIMLWDVATGLMVYDNQAGTSDDAELGTDGTLVQDGRITIFKK